MRQKIKVAFIFHKSLEYLTGHFFAMGQYHFFMEALKRNERINIEYIKTDDILDAEDLKKFDIILLWNNYYHGMPKEIKDIDKLDIPVISQIGDPHGIKKFDPKFEYHKKFKIDFYFGFVPEEYFYEYYPRKFEYKTIIYGLEPRIYEAIKPFKDRIKNKILNSGATGNTKIISRIINNIRNPESNSLKHYKLRTLCNKLPYVQYTTTLEHEYIGDKYTLLLQQYSAAIAATTYYPTRKYLEIPASGCLTFMEITKKNRGEFLGFIDGENSIFINEQNYKEKFSEYLNDVNNPKWERIANNGREYVLKNLNNDVAANSLIDLMEKLL